MKNILLFVLFTTLASCAPKAFPVGPNPLDTPTVDDGTPTIREGHMRAITGNQGWGE